MELFCAPHRCCLFFVSMLLFLRQNHLISGFVLALSLQLNTVWNVHHLLLALGLSLSCFCLPPSKQTFSQLLTFNTVRNPPPPPNTHTHTRFASIMICLEATKLETSFFSCAMQGRGSSLCIVEQGGSWSRVSGLEGHSEGPSGVSRKIKGSLISLLLHLPQIELRAYKNDYCECKFPSRFPATKHTEDVLRKSLQGKNS